MLRERKTQRRRPTQQRSRETADAILEAARRVIVASGVGGVRMREVARIAGVSVGTLYRYYATPEALLAAWEEAEITRRVAELGEHLAKVLEGPSTAEQAIYSVVRMALRLMFEHMSRYRDHLRDLPSHREERMRILETVLGVVTSVMRANPKAARFRFEPEVGAHLAVRATTFLGFDVALAQITESEREAIEDGIARMIIHGIVEDG